MGLYHLNLEKGRDDEVTLNAPNSYFLVKNNSKILREMPGG